MLLGRFSNPNLHESASRAGSHCAEKNVKRLQEVAFWRIACRRKSDLHADFYGRPCVRPSRGSTSAADFQCIKITGFSKTDSWRAQPLFCRKRRAGVVDRLDGSSSK